jgi:hypothetical protein
VQEDSCYKECEKKYNGRKYYPYKVPEGCPAITPAPARHAESYAVCLYIIHGETGFFHASSAAGPGTGEIPGEYHGKPCSPRFVVYDGGRVYLTILSG